MSFIIQHVAYPIYNKIPSKSQPNFSNLLIFPMLQIIMKQPLMKLKAACPRRGHSFILVHIHPFADQQPTKEDHKITEEMIEVGRLMQIPLKDHVIIGKDWFSFFERRINGENLIQDYI
jgi:hypothetical protein